MKQSKSDKGNSRPQPSKSSSEGFKVIPTPNFLKEASELEKKYPNIREDFLALAKTLNKDPITGNDHIFKDLWKVRMAISDKNQGQSGGARVIIEVKVIDAQVFVLSVYDKSVREDLTDDALKALMNQEKPTPKQKAINYREQIRNSFPRRRR